MAAETETRNFAERFSTGFRNLFIVGALIGAAAMIVAAPLGETLFVAGVQGAAAGEVGRRVTKPKK